MALTSIIKGGAATDRDPHRTLDAVDAPAKMAMPGRVGGQPYRHEIFQFSDAIGEQESRHQDVCRRPIELFAPHLIADRADLKATSFVVVQNCAKDAWSVEMRIAIPIDRPVPAD